MDKNDHSGSTLWRTAAISLGLRTEQVADRIKQHFASRHSDSRPLEIQPYRGHGADGKFSIRGRVLRYQRGQETNRDTVWANLKRSYLMFETDELAGARVCLTIGQLSLTTRTDEEGYFFFENVDCRSLMPDGHDPQCILSLPDFPDLSTPVTGPIYWLDDTAEFGVISDIDDTILLTQATSLLSMMRTTLLESPASRLAFHGVSTFYKGLHKHHNPFFYVSSSPWNLYTFLEDFMALNDIVNGPMYLRDFGIDKQKFIAGPHDQHKRNAIERILGTTGTLKFVLIGDSGQRDPEIYAQIARNHPTRILSIYIRDRSNKERDENIVRLGREMTGLGIDLVLVADTLEAARHAHTNHLIDDDALAAISGEITL